MDTDAVNEALKLGVIANNHLRELNAHVVMQTGLEDKSTPYVVSIMDYMKTQEKVIDALTERNILLEQSHYKAESLITKLTNLVSSNLSSNLSGKFFSLIKELRTTLKSANL